MGAPKCGTTALYEFLKQHPDIYLPEQKELKHLATEINEEIEERFGYLSEKFNKTNGDYIKHFEGSKSEKILGDITPSYLFSKTAAKEIHEFNPDVKIVAIF